MDDAVSLNLVNLKAFCNGSLRPCAIHIKDGKIRKIGNSTNLPRADTKIDCTSLIALPGMIDVHVHLRDLGLSYKEDFYSGSAAAAAGGFTSIIDMPNTQPPTDSLRRLSEKIVIAARKVVVNTGFHVAPPEDPSELRQMKRAGAFSCKFYLLKPIGPVDVRQPTVLTEYLKLCKRVGLPATIHAEDGQAIEEQLRRVKAPLDLNGFLRMHSPSREHDAAKIAMRAASAARAKIHFSHVTSPRTLTIIKMARGRLQATCEVTPHHLLLDRRDMARAGPLAMTVPPLRSIGERRGLFDAFRAGSIDVLATDHAPHPMSEKQGDDYSKVSPGIPGLETALPLMLTLVKRKMLSLRRVVDRFSRRPAQIFGLGGKGVIGPGADADITLVDQRQAFRINSADFLSKAKHSPFDGWKCVGRPVMTFVGGRLVMDHGEIVANPGSGAILRSV